MQRPSQTVNQGGPGLGQKVLQGRMKCLACGQELPSLPPPPQGAAVAPDLVPSETPLEALGAVGDPVAETAEAPIIEDIPDGGVTSGLPRTLPETRDLQSAFFQDPGAQPVGRPPRKRRRKRAPPPEVAP